MSNQKDSEFFKGFLFGGLLGAAVAFLTAPKSGREIREDLKKASFDLSDDAEQKLHTAQEKAKVLLRETQTQLDELRKEVEGAVSALRDTAEEKVNEGIEVVNKEKGRLKDAVDAGVAAFQKEKATKSRKNV